MAPRSAAVAVEQNPHALSLLPINRITSTERPADLAPPQVAFPERPRTRLVKFLCEAPSAAIVAIAGTFTDWQPQDMFQDVTGVWGIVQHLLPGEYEYRLMIDGVWCTDPANPHKAVNQYGAATSILIVH